MIRPRLNIIFLLFFEIIAAGCSRSQRGTGEDNPLIRQRCVAQLMADGRFAVELESLYGNHSVGIVVSDKMWEVLSKAVSNDSTSIQVEVANNTNSDIQMSTVKLGEKGTFCDHVLGCRYLFQISAHSSVQVRIKLPIECDWLRKEQVNIIVMKDPRETEW